MRWFLPPRLLLDLCLFWTGALLDRASCGPVQYSISTGTTMLFYHYSICGSTCNIREPRRMMRPFIHDIS